VELTGWPVLSGDLAPATTTSDAAGEFELVGIHPGVGGVRVEVAGESWPTQYLPGVYEENEAELVPVADGALTELGERTLLGGIGISGEIRGPEGLVDGATVRVYSPGKVRSTSSVDGWYEVAGMPPGEALAWASAEGLATTYYPDADRPGDRVAVDEEGQVYAEMHLELPSEARFEGQVQALLPTEGASILLYNDTRTVGFGAQVDEDGRFEIGGLHGGSYTLEIFAAAMEP
jgi:hypothetical protein